MKRLVLSLCLVVVLVASFSLTGCTEGDETTTALSIPSGLMGSSLYTNMIGIASIIEKHVDGVTATPETSTGPTENTELFRDGLAEITILSAIDTYQSRRGIEQYDGQGQCPFSVLIPGHSSCFNYIVPEGSPITSLSDLKDNTPFSTTLNPNIVRAGSPIGAKQLGYLEKYYDITDDDYTYSPYFGLPDLTNEYKEGRVDFFWYPAGVPNASIQEMVTSKASEYIGVESDTLDAICEESPWFIPYTMEAGEYPGQDYDVTTVGYIYFIVIHNDLSEDLVYDIAKALYEHNDELVDIHPTFAEYTLDNISRNTVAPWHPGVVKYFKEKGLWTTELEDLQNDLLDELS